MTNLTGLVRRHTLFILDTSELANLLRAVLEECSPKHVAYQKLPAFASQH